jgi:uncharacterized protein YuzE
MKLKYFKDTDTLYIEFSAQNIAETKDLNENTILDLDPNGNICAITFEHASDRTDVQQITLEGIAAEKDLVVCKDADDMFNKLGM